MPRDKRVDTYIAEAAPFAQPILKHLRKLVHQASPEIEEAIKWSSPFFLHGGKILCYMAAFKAHASFGFYGPGLEKVILGDGGKEGRGILGKLTTLDDLPADKVFLGYVKKAVALQTSGQRPKIMRKARPAPPTPPVLLEGLRGNPQAAANWQEFSPSARREYIEWILEAKRDETRQQRVRTTLEWVTEGKPRNWKYQNC